MRTAWLFPGQGSQRAGMGAEEFDRFPQLCAQADDVLGYSVRELCLTDAARLRQTRYAQPALYVVGALAYLARERDGGRPDFLAGHSLGEYGALFAAGCVDFATGLRLVARRAELMEQAAGGAMAAVVGVDPDRLAALLAGEALAGLDVANYNSPDQVVVSGPQPAIRALTQAVRELGSGTCIALNVSVACHSRYMAPAAVAFGEALAGVRFAAPNIPLISNVTARPHRVESVAELLAAQIRRPVRWLDSMRYLIDEGVTGIEEIGPGDVLT
ncbi:MAG TPA: ACP S-malonyltransferase, partial [Micromonosporaceae bacterium]|nr:ACP S-malonyltransferase [Micromonosporaceae bacterium]